MKTRDDVALDVLVEHTRAVLTMRRAYREERFGLVLGAGVSRGFTFHVPDWKALLSLIASHAKVGGIGVDKPESGMITRADVLYQHFTARRLAALRAEYQVTDESARSEQDKVERMARAEWREIIREILYKSSPVPERLHTQHPYLGEFLEIVLNSPLTVTYNFDSYLESMLSATPGSRGLNPRGRGFETVFEGLAPVRSRKGVIYHPNGYLPQNVLEKASERLVFSAEEFGDQLMDSIAGRYSSLSYHLSKNISLFLGLSLVDENLRYFLRRNAVNHPGHHHYYVEYQRSENDIPQDRRTALFGHRFTTYNLITLFLTDSQIAALGYLIKLRTPEFLELTRRAAVPNKYIYYLTGVPGIGKTTALRQLASVGVYDEWMSDPNPLLARPHNELEEHERETLDSWVADEFRRKNHELVVEEEGVMVVERAPLDPISFERSDRIADKARRFAKRVIPGRGERLAAGDVVLLWGDPEIVSSRIAGRQTTPQRPDYIGELQASLRDRIYGREELHPLRSTEWRINELAKRVAEVIHLKESRPMDLHDQLSRLQEGA